MGQRSAHVGSVTSCRGVPGFVPKWDGATMPVPRKAGVVGTAAHQVPTGCWYEDFGISLTRHVRSESQGVSQKGC